LAVGRTRAAIGCWGSSGRRPRADSRRLLLVASSFEVLVGDERVWQLHIGELMELSKSEARQPRQTPEEIEEEGRKIRRLQIMMSMVMAAIGQDPNLTLEEASELVAGAKRAALAMFPDKEFTYDLLYKPRLQRLMTERFRMQ